MTTPAQEPGHRQVPEAIADKVGYIEQTFTLYAGPVARVLIPETYRRWTGRHKPRLANLVFYAQRLSDLLPSELDQAIFLRETTDVILTGSMHSRHEYALER